MAAPQLLTKLVPLKRRRPPTQKDAFWPRKSKLDNLGTSNVAVNVPLEAKAAFNEVFDDFQSSVDQSFRDQPNRARLLGPPGSILSRPAILEGETLYTIPTISQKSTVLMKGLSCIPPLPAFLRELPPITSVGALKPLPALAEATRLKPLPPVPGFTTRIGSLELNPDNKACSDAEPPSVPYKVLPIVSSPHCATPEKCFPSKKIPGSSAISRSSSSMSLCSVAGGVVSSAQQASETLNQSESEASLEDRFSICSTPPKTNLQYPPEPSPTSMTKSPSFQAVFEDAWAAAIARGTAVNQEPTYSQANTVFYNTWVGNLTRNSNLEASSLEHNSLPSSRGSFSPIHGPDTLLETPPQRLEVALPTVSPSGKDNGSILPTDQMESHQDISFLGNGRLLNVSSTTVISSPDPVGVTQATQEHLVNRRPERVNSNTLGLRLSLPPDITSPSPVRFRDAAILSLPTPVEDNDEALGNSNAADMSLVLNGDNDFNSLFDGELTEVEDSVAASSPESHNSQELPPSPIATRDIGHTRLSHSHQLLTPSSLSPPPSPPRAVCLKSRNSIFPMHLPRKVQEDLCEEEERAQESSPVNNALAARLKRETKRAKTGSLGGRIQMNPCFIPQPASLLEAAARNTITALRFRDEAMKEI